MAVRTFYGICTTASGESEKEVIISDIDLTEDANLETDGFQFKEGDLLVVFFANTNTVPTPSVVIDIPDTNEQVSTSIDSGKLIKSLDVEANMENAWAAGETVIFAYTQQGTTDTYYWELVDANHASKETYGDTKLFDDTDFSEWITKPEADVDSEIALTPNTLKKFFVLLTTPAQSEDKPDPEELIAGIGLNWTPDESTAGLEMQPLGVLSLNNGNDGITIDYPLQAKVEEYVNEQVPNIIKYTGQLTNNGNGKNGDKSAEPRSIDNPEGAEPFITRIVPDNLYFGNGQGIFYGEPANNPTTGIVLNNNDVLSIKGTNGIALNSPTDVSGNLTASNLISSGAITATQGGTISTSGGISGGILYEGGTALRNKYSGKLYTTWTGYSASHSLNAKESASHKTVAAPVVSGYTLTGVIGWDISYAGAKDNGDGKWANLWECWVTGNNINYAIANVSTERSIAVHVRFHVLYVRNV